jgi:hypothetical protein
MAGGGEECIASSMCFRLIGAPVKHTLVHHAIVRSEHAHCARLVKPLKRQIAVYNEEEQRIGLSDLQLAQL